MGSAGLQVNPMFSPIHYLFTLWYVPFWQLSERLPVNQSMDRQCPNGLHACSVWLISILTGLLIQLLALDLRPDQMTYLLMFAAQQQTQHGVSHETRSLTYIAWWPHFHHTALHEVQPKVPFKQKETYGTGRHINKGWRLRCTNGFGVGYIMNCHYYFSDN